MADVVDKATRSRMMSGIQSKHTRPEIQLRKALHARGYRFRLHDKRLPGAPDIVLARWKVAILVQGCFWHRHPGCRYATRPATRAEFWETKLNANVERDNRNQRTLIELGWRVAVVWECMIRSSGAEEAARQIASWIEGPETQLDISQ